MANRSGLQANRYVEREVVQRILKFLDAGVLFAGSVIISLMSVIDLAVTTPQVIGFLAAELALVCVFTMRAAGLYDVNALTQGLWTALRASACCLVVGGILYVLTHLFLLQMDYGWMYLWMMLLPAYFGLTRGVISLWAGPRAAEGRFRQRIAVVGGGKAAEQAIALLESSRGLDVEIVGMFDDRDDERSPQSVLKYQKIGRIDDLADYARAQRVDLIIVAIPLSAEHRLLNILRRLWELPVDIRISGHTSNLKLNARAYTYLGKLPLLSVFDRPLKGWNLFQKEALDRIVGSSRSSPSPP